MLNKYIEFSSRNNLPEDIQRYIFKYIPLYDRLYLSSKFIDNLFQQLFECRDEYFRRNKYISYYNNLRTTVFKIPWRDDFTWYCKESNIIYSMSIINQEIHVSIVKLDGEMFSYDEMLYMESVFYDTKIHDIDCSIHEYITERIPIEIYYFIDAYEFKLKVMSNQQHDNITENRFITLDKILHQLHINIFSKINKIYETI